MRKNPYHLGPTAHVPVQPCQRIRRRHWLPMVLRRRWAAIGGRWGAVGSTFWETAAARWGQIWAWQAVATTHLGSDRASWCQPGHAYLPGTVPHHLDPVHRRRALRTAYGHDPALLAQVTQGVGQRDGAAVDQALTAAIRASRGRVREALRGVRRYLEQHWAGITAPDAPFLGSTKARCLTGWLGG
jgi:hypothetical protein